ELRRWFYQGPRHWPGSRANRRASLRCCGTGTAGERIGERRHSATNDRGRGPANQAVAACAARASFRLWHGPEGERSSKIVRTLREKQDCLGVAPTQQGACKATSTGIN